MPDATSEPQDRRGLHEDQAEQRIDRTNPSAWEHEKHDLKTHQIDPDGSPPSGDGHPVHAQPPEAFTGLRLTQPAKTAAGFQAVTASAKHLFSNVGPIRGTRLMLKVNQKHGIDCTSCAWPEPDGDRMTLEFCESGAKAIADEATTARCTPEFFAKHCVAELSEMSDLDLGKAGRLTHPMVLREGASHYHPISWDDAFGLLAKELNALASPDEAIFYTSGRTSNETAFLYQLFARRFGTNNLPDCSNMCHESSGSALTPTIGIGKGTVTLGDFEKAQVIVCIGQNPGTNHPRMLTTLQKAKRGGAKMIAINPLREAGLLNFRNPQEAGGMLGISTHLTDLYLQVRLNGDMAVLKGIMKEMLEAGHIDRDFIQSKTAGFDDFAAALQQVIWDAILGQSGISRQQIHEAANILGKADRIIICWAMGLTQQPNAVAIIQEIVNLLLLRGSIGKPGAGACPVRGHSNVQGDRTMGIWERPRKDFLDKLQAVFGFDPPRHHGFDTVESIKAMHEGKAKVFFAMGGNFLSATPDTEYTAAALRNARLTAHVSTKLNRAHLVTGRQALILPCLGRTEIDRQSSGDQFVTTENSMGVVETSQGILDPASEHLLSEPMIVARLAQATVKSEISDLQFSAVGWLALASNYDLIRDLIAKTIPGCENYNEKVRRPGGFYLPNKPREGDFSNTPAGKASFTVHPLPEQHVEPGQLIMTTIRSHDQFNTTLYGLDDRYRGVHHERRVIFVNADDLRERGLKATDIVDITSHFKGKRRLARRFICVPYNIPRGCCATYFPEGNVLVPIDSVAEKSNTPTSKYVIVTLSRASSQGSNPAPSPGGADANGRPRAG
jgi:molybdopterin-dependent oxidoreductase alpha subunit